MTVRIHVFDLFTRRWKGEIVHSTVAFNSPVNGIAQMDLTIPISARNVDEVRSLTALNGNLIVAAIGEQLLFGGIAKIRFKKPDLPELDVKVVSLKSWLFTVFSPAALLIDGAGQFDAARTVAASALALDGAPLIDIRDGVAGDVAVLTSGPWDSYGKILDTFGNRDGGLEWDLEFSRSSDPSEDLMVELAFYQALQPRTGDDRVFFDLVERSGKATASDIVDDQSDTATWVWALGDGQPPDQSYSYNFDPLIGDSVNPKLRIEAAKSYSGVRDPAVLTDLAIYGRTSSLSPQLQVNVDHDLDNPSITLYQPGDRCRFRVSNGWDDLDLRGVRIVDRAIRGSTGGLTTVTAVLDLHDPSFEPWYPEES